MKKPTRASANRTDVVKGRLAAVDDRRSFNLRVSTALMAEFTGICKAKGYTVAHEVGRLIEAEVELARKRAEKRRKRIEEMYE